MRACLTVGAIVLLVVPFDAQVRFADESDRTAFRNWFVLLADAEFYKPSPDVVDCAALVRRAVREALREHSPEWLRRAALPVGAVYSDVRARPRGSEGRLPLFRISDGSHYAEFADAKTIVALNTRRVARDVTAARPGDLLYFRQADQQQPDHLMVFVGRSLFEEDGSDWIVYHTGPTGLDPGEVRKVRLSDLLRHPSPRWRPLTANPSFVGVFRWVFL